MRFTFLWSGKRQKEMKTESRVFDVCRPLNACNTSVDILLETDSTCIMWIRSSRKWQKQKRGRTKVFYTHTHELAHEQIYQQAGANLHMLFYLLCAFDKVQNSICGFSMWCALHLWSVLLSSLPTIFFLDAKRFPLPPATLFMSQYICRFPNSPIYNLEKPVNNS